jgi:NADH dehydrogenase
MKVVILGGGFAGVHLAAQLEASGLTGRDLEVTLVSREPHCTLTPLLVDVLAGALPPQRAVKPIEGVLRRTAFVKGEIETLNLPARRVAVRAGRERLVLTYDHLVLALGGIADDRDLPGKERAYTFWSLSDAVSLRHRVLDELRAERPEPPGFVVVGGGLLGVEVAAELAGLLEREAVGSPPRLALVAASDRLLPGQGAAMAEAATEALTRRGVDIYLNGFVEAIEPSVARLKGGICLPSDVAVLATGVKPSPLVTSLPMPHDRLGRVMVRPTLQSLTRPDVWALGDCAAVPGPDGVAPSLAQHAVRQAETVARNLEAMVRCQPMRAYDYRTLGVMCSLGPREAVAEVQGWTTWGEGVWWARRAYYGWALPGMGDRLGLMANWALDSWRSPWHLPRLLEGLRPPQGEPAEAGDRFNVTWLPVTAEESANRQPGDASG